MRNLLIVFAFITSVASFSQDSTEVTVKEVKIGLGFGEETEIEGNFLKFEGVISDSRCPQDVNCVWAGEAKVLFSYFEDGKRKEKIVVLNPNASGAGNIIFNFENQDVFAHNLQPYPQVNRKIHPSEYKIELLVRENVEK